MRKNHFVVISEKGKDTTLPFRKWFCDTQSVPNAKGMTTHQMRNHMKRKGWLVRSEADRVLIVQSGVKAVPETPTTASSPTTPQATAKLSVTLRPRMSSQIVGNIGLYYVCCELSKQGWNVMPTARNARGIDIVCYDHTGEQFIGVQVKSLSHNDPVPLGNSLNKIMGDYWIIVTNLAVAPAVFIMKPEEVKAHAHRGEKDGKVSYWLQPRGYTRPEYANRWDRIPRDPVA